MRSLRLALAFPIIVLGAAAGLVTLAGLVGVCAAGTLLDSLLRD